MTENQTDIMLLCRKDIPAFEHRNLKYILLAKMYHSSVDASKSKILPGAKTNQYVDAVQTFLLVRVILSVFYQVKTVNESVKRQHFEPLLNVFPGFSCSFSVTHRNRNKRTQYFRLQKFPV